MSTGGPTVLLLHGQPGGAADWDEVVALLGDRAQPVAVDRPGWDGNRRARDLEGNARAALQELDARGVERAVIAGHSLGAAIAAWIAGGHPERVAGLVLAAPAANLASLYAVDRWLAAPVAAELASSAALGGIGLALSVAPIRHRIASRTGLTGAYLETVRAASLRPISWLAYAAEQRALVRGLPELEQRLGQITAPTAILTGGRDRVVPPDAARELARQIPGARLAVRADAGHMLPQREPEFVAEAITQAIGACR
ncbi:MAG: alpha/beta hydrolase [Solirubrobacteraceae bacterium]